MSKRYYCDVCNKEYKIIKSNFVPAIYIYEYATDSMFSGLQQSNSDICEQCKTKLCKVLREEIAKIQKEYDYHPGPINNAGKL